MDSSPLLIYEKRPSLTRDGLPSRFNRWSFYFVQAQLIYIKIIYLISTSILFQKCVTIEKNVGFCYIVAIKAIYI